MARWSFLVWGVLALSAGCGRSAGSTGSNTNWLTRCNEDGDCGTHGVCWCGACTKSCDDGDACHEGSCHASDELGCGTPSGASVCVATCSANADCRENGAGVECVNGACLPTGSAGGAGGIGGTGATGGGGKAGQGSGAQASRGGGAGGTAAGAGGGSGGGGTAGEPSTGVPLEPGGAKLAVGGTHTCYLWNDGFDSHVECWGGNIYGQASALLPGTVDQLVAEPRRVDVPEPVAIAVSDEHSCALTASGDVYCWGANDNGQTGGPSAPEDTCPTGLVDDAPEFYECQPEPHRIDFVSNVVRIALTSEHSCALLANGTLSCWGNAGLPNAWLQGVADARSLSISGRDACAINQEGTLSCGYVDTSQFPPLDAVAMSASNDFGCTLGIDGGVRCFGDNSVGQLGDGMIITERGLPIATTDATAIAVGAAHACALGSDAKVRCWGRNTSGAIGTPPRTSPGCGSDYCEANPLEITGVPPLVAIAAGGDRTCGVAADRTLWCWERAVLERIGGPWEPGPAECWDRMSALTSGRRDAIAAADYRCKRDTDCISVSVDLSCAHSCSPATVSVSAAAGLADAIEALEADYCANGAGCGVPAASCAGPTTRPVCVEGTCTESDPDHSGCVDTCGCAAVIYATGSAVSEDRCVGFDLKPLQGIACGSCEQASSAIVVGNLGDAAFDGDATLSFEHTGGASDPPTLPEPVTVALHLAPGAVSEPIHVQSTGEGALIMRITAAGDCEPSNDDARQANFPEPTSACDN